MRFALRWSNQSICGLAGSTYGGDAGRRLEGKLEDLSPNVCTKSRPSTLFPPVDKDGRNRCMDESAPRKPYLVNSCFILFNHDER